MATAEIEGVHLDIAGETRDMQLGGETTRAMVYSVPFPAREKDKLKYLLRYTLNLISEKVVDGVFGNDATVSLFISDAKIGVRLAVRESDNMDKPTKERAAFAMANIAAEIGSKYLALRR